MPYIIILPSSCIIPRLLQAIIKDNNIKILNQIIFQHLH